MKPNLHKIWENKAEQHIIPCGWWRSVAVTGGCAGGVRLAFSAAAASATRGHAHGCSHRAAAPAASCTGRPAGCNCWPLTLMAGDTVSNPPAPSFQSPLPHASHSLVPPINPFSRLGPACLLEPRLTAMTGGQNTFGERAQTPPRERRSASCAPWAAPAHLWFT